MLSKANLYQLASFFHPLIVIKGLFNILLIFSWTRRGFRSLFTVYHHKDGRHRHNKGLHRHEDGRRGKFLRTSQWEGGKKLFPQMVPTSILPANIRFSGS